MSAASEMNFELPDELRMLKDAVRRFVDAEMIPVEMRSRVGDGMDPQIKADLVEKAKVLGLAGFDVPEEYGGQGFGLLAKAVVWAELGRTIALPPRAVEIFGPIISPLLYLMNDAQKARYLAPTLRGEYEWCFAQTEPDAAATPRASARRRCATATTTSSTATSASSPAQGSPTMPRWSRSPIAKRRRMAASRCSWST